MTAHPLNALLARLRAALPDRAATLTIAHSAPPPVDPVLDAYLREHVGFWRQEIGTALEVGPMREHQEDGLFVSAPGRAFVVIDGMGGHASGHLATQLVKKALLDAFPHAYDGEPLDRAEVCPLAAALLEAHHVVKDFQERQPQYRGQGAASAGIFVADTFINVAHVGDCRVYRLRDGALQLLTRDHSLVNEFADLVERGEADEHHFSAEEQKRYERIITRALGVRMEKVQPDWSRHPIEPGDQLLLCTDGLWRAVPDETLRELLCGDASPQEQAQALAQAAIDARTTDNLGIIVVRFPEVVP